MKDDSIILRLNSVTKRYNNQKDSNTVLDTVSFDIKEKEFLCVLGPSGCGKTTLLRCIAGFEEYAGSISIFGEEVRTPNIDRIMVFQDFNQLFPWMTVEKNVEYPLKIQKKYDKKTIHEISDDVLKKVNLEEYKKYYPHYLSGGMKQRVAIAKALALLPKVILMDEPFAALDAMTRSTLQRTLLKIYDETNTTFIFVTHNIQEALILGSRIMVFGHQGAILLDEKNILKKPVTPTSEGYGVLWQKLHDVLYDGI